LAWHVGICLESGKGQGNDFSEAIEVINYQENLKLERKKNSFMYKVKRWIGVTS